MYFTLIVIQFMIFEGMRIIHFHKANNLVFNPEQKKIKKKSEPEQHQHQHCINTPCSASPPSLRNYDLVHKLTHNKQHRKHSVVWLVWQSNKVLLIQPCACLLIFLNRSNLKSNFSDSLMQIKPQQKCLHADM